MKPIITTALLAFALLSSRETNAQTDVFPGYIVQLSGDTLRGFVRFVGRPSPRQIGFRASATGAEQPYLPAGLRAFGVTQTDAYPLAFVAYSGPVENSATRLDQLDTQPTPVFEPQAAFLERLVPGKLTLYLLIDKTDRRHYFIQKEQESPIELITKRFRIDGQTTQENAMFRNQLYGMLSDDSRFTERTLSEVSYDETSLAKLLARYNGTTSSKSSKRERILLTTELKVGGRYSNLTTTGLYEKYPFGAVTNLTGGVALKAALPRTNGRWSVYNDLLFENYSTSAALTTDATNQDGYTFSMRYLKLFTQIRREFGSGPIRPFVNAGISNAYALQAITTYTRTFYSTTTTSTTSLLAQSVRRHELGLTAGAGVTINRLGIELRYERTNGLINATNSSTSRQNIWLLVGYRLN